MRNNYYTGFAIALAWPQTYCKQAGAWYDSLMDLLNISNNNYYKVGHAALILIKKGENQCHYFDFGRYHAPKGFGRVRSMETDHELEMITIPEIKAGKLTNYDEILNELQSSDVFHGEGDLYASYSNINFENAYYKAQKLQHESPIVYGPFVSNGSNCSRFVSTVLRAGLPLGKKKLKMTFFVPFTPSPVSNVKSFQYFKVVPKPEDTPVFQPEKQPKVALLNTLQPAHKPSNLPLNAQWLSGEGSGSWFVISPQKSSIAMQRFSAKGILECTGNFYYPENHNRRNFVNFKVTHLSNCKQITVTNNKQTYILYKNIKVQKSKCPQHKIIA